eukprot:gene15187-17964_t
MQEQFGWSASSSGLILGSFYYGYTLTQIPGGRAAEVYGCKRVLIAAVLLWSLATVITPLLATYSFNALIGARILLGLAEGAHFPVMTLFLSLWFPTSERGRAITFSFLGIEAGTIFALVAAPWITQVYGWATNFYVFGSLGLVWCAFAEVNLSSHPQTHPGITDEELMLITDGRESKQRTQADWGKLIRSRSLWAVLSAHSCFAFVAHWLALWVPSYFRRHLNVGLSALPFYTVLPQICNALISLLGGYLSDLGVQKGYSTVSMQRCGCIVGFCVPAVLMQFFWFVTSPMAGAVLMCGAFGCLGLAAKCGHFLHMMESMPNHVASVMGVANTLGSVMGFASNLFAGWYLDTYDSWGGLFSIMGVFLFFGMISFLSLVRGG